MVILDSRHHRHRPLCFSDRNIEWYKTPGTVYHWSMNLGKNDFKDTIMSCFEFIQAWNELVLSRTDKHDNTTILFQLNLFKNNVCKIRQNLKVIQMVFIKPSVKQVINEWRTLIQWKVENEVAFHFVFILSIPYLSKMMLLI